MKCPTCRGPLTKVNTSHGTADRTKRLTIRYRCIVCGGDVEVAARRRARRRLMASPKAAKMKLVMKAS